MARFFWLVMLAWTATAATFAASPAGPIDAQNNFPVANLTGGWQPCLRITYAQNLRDYEAVINAVCSGPSLLVSCRPVDSAILATVAGGNKTQVLAPAGGDQVLTGSTTRFYRNADAWGFTIAGNPAPSSCLFAGSGTDHCRPLNLDRLLGGGTCAGNNLFTSTVETVLYTNPCEGKNVGDACISPNGACESGATCQTDGTCGNGTVTTCGPYNDCTRNLGCSLVNGTCDIEARPSGYSCDTGLNLCLADDQCDGNFNCIEGDIATPCEDNPPVCRGPGACPPLLGPGFCEFPLLPEDTACSGNSTCLINYRCTDTGNCTSSTPRDCSNPPSQLYLPGTCVEGTGCVYPPNIGGFCNSPLLLDDPCAISGIVQNVSGVLKCVATVTVDCSQTVGCFGPGIPTNVSNNCECDRPALPFNSTCDDLNPCTEDTRCNLNDECVGKLIDLPPPQQCLGVGSCVPLNETDYIAVYPNRPNGTLCDDFDVCTDGEVCLFNSTIGESVCTSPPRKECPGDQCNDPLLSCDAVDGCYDPKAGSPSCDDGNPCTENDSCDDGECIGNLNPFLPGCEFAAASYLVLAGV